MDLDKGAVSNGEAEPTKSVVDMLYTMYGSETDQNGTVTTFTCPDCICPKSPDCSCSASCSTKNVAFEGCHLPKSVFSKPSTVMDYTGFSNIPSIFASNELVVVKVDGFYEGCFYGFQHEGEIIVHRLLGVYDSYLVFKGDNNEGTEKVDKEAVQFLVREVRFT